jgi:hypothetical protein
VGSTVPDELKRLVDELTDEVGGLREEARRRNDTALQQAARNERLIRRLIKTVAVLAVLLVVSVIGLSVAGVSLAHEGRRRDDAIARNNQRGCDFFNQVAHLRFDPREPTDSAGRGIVRAAEGLAEGYRCPPA